ncbi:MAG: hypothetical protein MZV70_16215 [Desulfobacterales bacterium]|nr:hypothetical protein [Desulfobacterales bacterium]
MATSRPGSCAFVPAIGVYFHSYSALASGHHGFSAAHSRADIDEALNRIESALREI